MLKPHKQPKPAGKHAGAPTVPASAPVPATQVAAGRSPGQNSYAQGSAAVSPGNKPSYDQQKAARRPSPADPHLAKLELAEPMRQQIADHARENPSFYATLVEMVNGGLMEAGIGISDASHQSVMANVAQVHDGTIPQSAAHFREAETFAQDAVASASHGRVLQAAVEGSGAVINTVGGIGMAIVEALRDSKAGKPPRRRNNRRQST
jgi:hypothetical protein